MSDNITFLLAISIPFIAMFIHFITQHTMLINDNDYIFGTKNNLKNETYFDKKHKKIWDVLVKRINDCEGFIFQEDFTSPCLVINRDNNLVPNFEINRKTYFEHIPGYSLDVTFLYMIQVTLNFCSFGLYNNYFMPFKLHNDLPIVETYKLRIKRNNKVYQKPLTSVFLYYLEMSDINILFDEIETMWENKK